MMVGRFIITDRLKRAFGDIPRDHREVIKTKRGIPYPKVEKTIIVAQPRFRWLYSEGHN